MTQRLNEFAADREIELEIEEVHDEGSAAAVIATLATRCAGLVIDPGELDVQAMGLENVDVPAVRASLGRFRPVAAPTSTAEVVYGRGADTYRWALRHLHCGVVSPPVQHSYGPDTENLGDLRIPRGSGGTLFPVALLLHGGYWRDPWQRDLMDDVALDLAERGVATWNIEYRRVGPTGGGVPETLDDVAAGVLHLQKLADDAPLDLERIVLIGHSAGGQLALSVAASPMVRARLSPFGAIRGVISLAGMPELEEAARRGQGDGCVTDFVGGTPEQKPDSYRLASPAAHLPLGIPSLTIQGLADGPDFIDLNRTYAAEAAKAGDPAELVEVNGANHMAVIDPKTPTWTQAVSFIDTHCRA